MSDKPIPVGTTLLLKGGRALTPSADWHDPPQVDIAVARDKIVGVCSGYRLGDDQNLEVIEARDHLVLPGFVNAHYHSHDVLAKGTLEEVPLESWRLYALPPQYPPRSTEEVYARTLLGALECLRSGMTTIQDMLTLYPYEERHMSAVMKAYSEVGIRVVSLCNMLTGRGSKPYRSGRILSRASCIRCCRPPPSRKGNSI
jgi:guanine deaminase